MSKSDVRFDRGLLWAILATLQAMDNSSSKLWIFTTVVALWNMVLAIWWVLVEDGDAE